MEIRIFDNEMNLKSIIENFSSFLWHRQYNDTGDFTITCPDTPQNAEALQLGNIVWVKEKVDAGIIESRILDASSSSTLQVSGRFLSSVMDRRLVYPKINFNGKTEVAMRTLFTQAPTFPNIVLGDLNDYDETVEFQALYTNLLTYEQNLAKSANYGIRFRPDFITKQIIFEIYKGVDHSKTQTDRQRVIVSDEYENLQSVKYSENNKLYKTVCIVGGQGEEDYKTYVTVGDDSETGYNRRETYYEASDVESNGLTWAQYLAALRQKGEMILEQSRESETFECTIRTNGNFVYGKDYDLGDIVTVEKTKWGVAKDMRLTEITEVYETEIPKLQVVLGTPLPTTINWEV